MKQSKKLACQRLLINMSSLIRDAINVDAELKPFAERVVAKLKKWIFRHNAQRKTAFTEEQTTWLRLIKDHIAASCFTERDDFDCSPLSDRGGLQKAWGVFNTETKNELDSLMAEMNQELLA